MIKLQVIGHLGKDCTTNTVSGKNVINFNVAHSERYKDAQGNQQERTTWVECAYWTERVAIAPYLKKGQLVYVEGSPEVRTFTRNDGSSGASLTLRVLNVQLLGSARGGESQEAQGFAQRGQLDAPKVESPEVSSVEDDLPF